MIPDTFEGLREWAKDKRLPWAGPGEDGSYLQVDHGIHPQGEFYRVICYTTDDYVTCDTYYINGRHESSTRKWTPA